MNIAGRASFGRHTPAAQVVIARSSWSRHVNAGVFPPFVLGKVISVGRIVTAVNGGGEVSRSVNAEGAFTLSVGASHAVFSTMTDVEVLPSVASCGAVVAAIGADVEILQLARPEVIPAVSSCGVYLRSVESVAEVVPGVSADVEMIDTVSSSAEVC